MELDILSKHKDIKWGNRFSGLLPTRTKICLVYETANLSKICDFISVKKKKINPTYDYIWRSFSWLFVRNVGTGELKGGKHPTPRL